MCISAHCEGDSQEFQGGGARGVSAAPGSGSRCEGLREQQPREPRRAIGAGHVPIGKIRQAAPGPPVRQRHGQDVCDVRVGGVGGAPPSTEREGDPAIARDRDVP